MKNYVAKQFGKAASVYNVHATLQARIAESLWHVCAEHISHAPLLILDAGCGTAHLWSQVKNKHVMGVDSAFEMCRHAQAHIRATNATMESLPFADDSFDVVFSSYAMQWSGSLENAMAECSRVLKRGGVCALAVPIDGTLHELRESFAQTGFAPHVMAFRTAQEYENVFNEYELLSRHICYDCLHYDSPLALIRAIKQIGAGAVIKPARKGLMTARQLKQIEDYYRTHYGVAQQVVASWNTLMLIARKKDFA